MTKLQEKYKFCLPRITILNSFGNSTYFPSEILNLFQHFSCFIKSHPLRTIILIVFYTLLKTLKNGDFSPFCTNKSIFKKHFRCFFKNFGGKPKIAIYYLFWLQAKPRTLFNSARFFFLHFLYDTKTSMSGHRPKVNRPNISFAMPSPVSPM